jgi:hypothetical protein
MTYVNGLLSSVKNSNCLILKLGNSVSFHNFSSATLQRCHTLHTWQQKKITSSVVIVFTFQEKYSTDSLCLPFLKIHKGDWNYLRHETSLKFSKV